LKEVAEVPGLAELVDESVMVAVGISQLVES